MQQKPMQAGDGWTEAERILQAAAGQVFTAATVVVRAGGRVVWQRAIGQLHPEGSDAPAGPDSRFDLASVTKLFATTAFMTLVDEGKVSLQTPVVKVIPEFGGRRPIAPYEDPLHWDSTVTIAPEGGVVDADAITFWHLLTHTSGLAAWKPVFKVTGGPAARCDYVARSPFAYPTASRVLYSDLGLILLGEAMTRLTGLPLDRLIAARVCRPLGLTATSYNPPAHTWSQIAATEVCAWRGRRLQGQVHDENAYGMGGISGHAGLFSTAAEVARLGQLYLDGGAWAGRRVLQTETVQMMLREQVAYQGERRGIGFMLKADLPNASCGPLFPRSSFGHTGFTGTSLWVNPEQGVVVALLTNRVYFGRDAAGIIALRPALHTAVMQAILKTA